MFINSADILITQTRLCTLFNAILQTGIFPEMWSKAIISHLHNKRPLGLKAPLSNISRGAEGPGREILQRPPSVRPSRLVFAL